MPRSMFVTGRAALCDDQKLRNMLALRLLILTMSFSSVYVYIYIYTNHCKVAHLPKSYHKSD